MPTSEHEDVTFRDAERIGRKRAFIEYYTHILLDLAKLFFRFCGRVVGR
jgi:hypothetical protein